MISGLEIIIILEFLGNLLGKSIRFEKYFYNLKKNIKKIQIWTKNRRNFGIRTNSTTIILNSIQGKPNRPMKRTLNRITKTD
jgi:hypothetical protein